MIFHSPTSSILLLALLLGTPASGSEEALSPGSLNAMKWGDAAVALEDWPLAIVCFENARLAEPLQPTVLFNLALAHEKAGHDLAAAAWFNAYLSAAPGEEATSRRNVIQKIREIEAGLRRRIAAIHERARSCAQQLRIADKEALLARIAASSVTVEGWFADPAAGARCIAMGDTFQAGPLEWDELARSLEDNRWNTDLPSVIENAADLEAAAACDQLAIVAECLASDLRRVMLLEKNIVAAEPWSMELEWIPGGTFRMGSTRNSGTMPVRAVTLDGFWMGRYEVTVEQWKSFVASTHYRTDAEKQGRAFIFQESEWKDVEGANWRNPGFLQDDRHPASAISWNDAKAFCEWITGKTGRLHRLPTEAEWEYACRAGTTTKYYWGDEPSGLHANGRDDAGWPTDGHPNSAPIGRYRPNAFGLHDMTGNIWEWCEDRYGVYTAEDQSNPEGPTIGEYRVLRGGSWGLIADKLVSTYRSYEIPNRNMSCIGFRCVVVSQSP